MNFWKRFSRRTILSIVLLLALIPASALAGSITNGGITLEWPNYPMTGPALISCEPWYEPTASSISLTGIPEGSTVIYRFAWSNPYLGAPNFQPLRTLLNVTGGSLTIDVEYPMNSADWPVFNQTTNERAIAVAVFTEVRRPDGTIVKLNSKQWWVRCLPPPPPFEGCTPGYWRQDQHFDSWVPTGYAPSNDFEGVFSVNASFDPHTMLDAVWLGGGGEFALARHAVAALLNASHPDINFQYTPAQVLSMVQAAYASGDFEPTKDLFDAANNAGCPLN